MVDSTTGIVMDIDHFGIHDGPGIRTCIFLKGCPLSCAWCHSPESQSGKPQILFAISRCERCGACVDACPLGLHSIHAELHPFQRENCTACGRCVFVCPTQALTVSGKTMTVEEVVREALSDKVFYKNSGGGVTITGGEVLVQAPFARQILEQMKKNDIHTIVETSGYGELEDLLSLAEVTDLFYFDFKLGDPDEFERYAGGNLDVVLRNLVALRDKTDRITMRFPLIPGITDTPENVASCYSLAVKLQIGNVHLLPYNLSSEAKYSWIGAHYSLSELQPRERLFQELLLAAPDGIHVEVMS